MSEKLIEEAAEAIAFAPPMGDARAEARRDAEIAYAVFEKAHTLTDDEREATATAIRLSLRFDLGWSADEARTLGAVLAEPVAARLTGLRRSQVPEPSAERDLTPCGNLVCTGCRACGCPALGIEPQGEPSDAWLDNLSYAATALEASADNGDRYCARLIREHLAALRAALAAR